MMKKGILAGLLFGAVLMLAPMTVSAAESSDITGGQWINNGYGWWYQTADGGYLSNGIYTIDGDDYCFNANGFMYTGWYAEQKGEYWTDYHFFDRDNGKMVKGWVFDEGSWYHLNTEDGGMDLGWIQDGTEWYYMNPYSNSDDFGKMETNAVAPYYMFGEDVKYYAIGEDGKVIYTPGWHFIDDNGWVFAEANGVLAYNKWIADGAWYHLGYSCLMDTNQWVDDYYVSSTGAMVTGWYNRAPYDANSESWVYTNADGTRFDGWLQNGSSWYYIDRGNMVSDGLVVWGEKTAADGSKTLGYTHTGYYIHNDTTQQYGYLFANDGQLVTGWYNRTSSNDNGYNEGNRWYYANGNGELVNGWIQDGTAWYYISSGVMSYGGAKLTKDYNLETETMSLEDFAKEYTYVFLTDGKLSSGGWSSYRYDGITDWFYANADGKAYDGWLSYNGAWYYIDCGRMLRDQFTPDGLYVDANGVWQ